MKIKCLFLRSVKILVWGLFLSLISCSKSTFSLQLSGDGHGPDKGKRRVPVGEMNSYWRLSRLHVDDDPVATFDFVHDRFAKKFDGHYDQMTYPHEMLAGQKGEIKSGAFDDGKIVIEWQPTADQDEVYTFKGEFSGLENLRLENDRFVQRETYIGEVSSNRPGLLFKAKLQRPPYYFDLKK